MQPGSQSAKHGEEGGQVTGFVGMLTGYVAEHDHGSLIRGDGKCPGLDIMAIASGNDVRGVDNPFGPESPDPGQFTADGCMGLVARSVYAQDSVVMVCPPDQDGDVLSNIEDGAGGWLREIPEMEMAPDRGNIQQRFPRVTQCLSSLSGLPLVLLGIDRLAVS